MRIVKKKYEPSYRYKAFFSYNKQADGQLSPVVQQSLQTFGKPWYRKRSFEIFRDETGLNMTHDLWGGIEEELNNSEQFVLFASPEAAVSRWVIKEVVWWLHNRSIKTLHIVLTAGLIEWDHDKDHINIELTTSLPQELMDVLNEEPLYLDLRWAKNKEQLTLDRSKFRSAIRHLSATLIGKTPEEVYSEEARVLRRNLLTAGGAIVLLIALFITTLISRHNTRLQKIEADRRSMIAQARYLASESLSQHETNHSLSMLLGLESLRATDPLGYHLAMSRQAVLDALRLDKAGGLGLPGHDGFRDYASAFSSDSNWLVTGDDVGNVLLWDLRQKHGSIEKRDVANSNGPGIELLAINHKRRLVAILTEDRLLRLKSFDMQMPLHFKPVQLEGNFRVTDLRFSPDGHHISILSNGEAVTILNLEVERPVRILPQLQEGNKRYTYSVSQNGRWCVGVARANQTPSPLVYWDLSIENPFDHPHYVMKAVKTDRSYPLHINSDKFLIITSGQPAIFSPHNPSELFLFPVGLSSLSNIVFSPEAGWCLVQTGAGKLLMANLRKKSGSFHEIILPGISDNNPAKVLAVHPDGNMLAVKEDSIGNSVYVRKEATWVLQRRLPLTTDYPSIRYEFSSDGKWLFGDSFTNTDVFDSKTLTLQHKLNVFTDFRKRKFLSPNGCWLLGNDGIIPKLWELDQLKAKRSLSGFQLWLSAPYNLETFFSKGWIGQTDDDGNIRIMDLGLSFPNIRGMAINDSTGSQVELLRFSANDKLALLTSDNRIGYIDLKTVDLSKPETLFEVPYQTAIRKRPGDGVVDYATPSFPLPASLWAAMFGFHSKSILEISNLGNYIAYGNRDYRELFLWSLLSPMKPIPLGTADLGVSSMKFSGDENWLIATPIGEKAARLWFLGGGDLSKPLTLEVTADTVHGATLDDRGKWAVAWGAEGECRLWHLRDQGNISDPLILPGHVENINGAVFSPDGHWLATLGNDKTIRLWNLQTKNPGEKSFILKGHTDYVSSASISNDSRWLATAGHGDANVRLWDLQSDNPEEAYDVLPKHGYAGIVALTFSPDNRWLLTWGGTPNARLWDLASEKPSQSMLLLRGDFDRGTEEDNTFAGFTLDSKWVLFNNNGQFFAKSLNPEIWEAHIERFSARNLTKKELQIYFPASPDRKVFDSFNILEK